MEDYDYIDLEDFERFMNLKQPNFISRNNILNATNIPIATAQNPAMVNYGIGTLPQFDMANLPMYEKDDSEQEYIPGTDPQESGIVKLFQFLGNLPTPFNLARRGLESLRGLNQRIRQSDFGQSRTGAEYMMRRRERKQAERAQEAMPDVYRSAREQGFTNDRGGFSTSRADRAGTSLGSGQFSSKRSTGRQGY
jgi:hypothetical protein